SRLLAWFIAILRRTRQPIDEDGRYDHYGDGEAQPQHARLRVSIGRRNNRVHRTGSRAAHALDKAREKLVGDLRGRAVDEARSDLRELAADLSVHRVFDPRSGAVRREIYLRVAARKAGRPALPLETHLVRRWGDDVRQKDATAELRRYGTDARSHRDLEFGIRNPLDRLAAGNAGLERLGIVQRRPGFLYGRRHRAAARQFHARRFLCILCRLRGSAHTLEP